jgi:hypothetical protein
MSLRIAVAGRIILVRSPYPTVVAHEHVQTLLLIIAYWAYGQQYKP